MGSSVSAAYHLSRPVIDLTSCVLASQQIKWSCTAFSPRSVLCDKVHISKMLISKPLYLCTSIYVPGNWYLTQQMFVHWCNILYLLDYIYILNVYYKKWYKMLLSIYIVHMCIPYTSNLNINHMSMVYEWLDHWK